MTLDAKLKNEQLKIDVDADKSVERLNSLEARSLSLLIKTALLGTVSPVIAGMYFGAHAGMGRKYYSVELYSSEQAPGFGYDQKTKELVACARPARFSACRNPLDSDGVLIAGGAFLGLLAGGKVQEYLNTKRGLTFDDYLFVNPIVGESIYTLYDYVSKLF